MPYEPKTRPTDADVAAFISSSPKPEEGRALCATMRRVSGAEPRMWGPTIVGFGSRMYALAGGRQGQMLAIGFAPRRGALVLYLPHAAGWDERLARLGKHSTGQGCLYLSKLADVDLNVLEELIAAAWAQSQRL
jgi:hypothetical protein